MGSGESTGGAFRSESGVWIRANAPFPGTARPALFLDRDGVIVAETNYLCSAKDVLMIEGASRIIGLANSRGIPVVVVTNQAGIGRGYFDWTAFQEVQQEIERQLELSGAWIDATLACPFHPEGRSPWRHDQHPARKPLPGMLHTASTLLNLDLSRSWIIGDHSTDIEAGFNANLRGALHVLTGHGHRERPVALGRLREGFDLRLGDSILDGIPLVDLLANPTL